MLEMICPSVVLVAAMRRRRDVEGGPIRPRHTTHATTVPLVILSPQLARQRGALRSRHTDHRDHRVRERADAGFTLVELMIGLLIAAFLAMMALPSFSQFLRNSEVRSASESIVNGLRLARSEATNRNQAVVFSLAGAGDPGWSINLLRDGSLLQKYSKQEGGAYTSVAILPANALAVTFNGLGRIVPAVAGANPNLKQLDISSLAPGARALRIYVDDTHGVRMCDPSPELAALAPRDGRAC
jgi:type IV fimbrial biogenesis protein FimT